MLNAVHLEFSLKDGKSSVKASITTGTADEAVSEYENLLNRFAAGPSPTPAKGKKTDTAETSISDASESAGTSDKNVVEMKPGTRASKKMFAQQALELNELAITWANRMAVAIPEFNNRSAQQIVEQLNFRKPMATMEIPELQEVIGLIKSTLTQYSANNPGVTAYLKVLDVIDHLTTGTPEEWTSMREAITGEDWAVLDQPGNAGMLSHAKSQLADRQTLLQAANIAAEAV